jgi:hypothetical protein
MLERLGDEVHEAFIREAAMHVKDAGGTRSILSLDGIFPQTEHTIHSCPYGVMVILMLLKRDRK